MTRSNGGWRDASFTLSAVPRRAKAARCGRAHAGMSSAGLQLRTPGNRSRFGVGTAIVREIERIARDHGLTHLNLESSVNAELFYATLGYEVIGSGVANMCCAQGSGWLQ